MFEQPHQCGVCHQSARFPFFSVGRYRGKAGEERLNDEVGLDGRTPDEMTVRGFGLSHCPHCGTPTLFLFKVKHKHIKTISDNIGKPGIIMAQDTFLSDVLSYPEIDKAEQDPLWPDSLRRQFADAQDILAQDRSPSIVLATCRSVLELALKELDPKDVGSSLFKRIEKLHQDGTITTPIKDWAHAVRLDGNAATHAGELSRTF